MARLTVPRIQKLIYPVSFYRHKARHVKETCRLLVEQFGGAAVDRFATLADRDPCHVELTVR